VSLSLSGNNLRGELPQCLHEFDLFKLDLSGNAELTGEPGNLSTSLRELHYKYTGIRALPPNICELKSLTTLRTEWANVSLSPFPVCLFALPGLTTFDVLDGNMPGEDSQEGYAPTQFSETRLQVGGNDVRLFLDFTLLDPSPSSYFDISDSNTTGARFDISRFLKAFPSVSDANLQGNAISGVFEVPGRDFLSHPIKTLDVSDNLISGVFHDGLLTNIFSKLPQPMLAFAFARNRITGLAPLMSEVEGIFALRPDLKIFDMEGNPFLCRPGENTVFGCTELRIDSFATSFKAGSCQVDLNVSTSELVNPAYPQDLQSGLSLLAADYSSGEPSSQKVVLAEGVSEVVADPENPRLLTMRAPFSCARAAELGLFGRNLTKADFGLAFDGVEVSTGNATAPVINRSPMVQRSTEYREQHVPDHVTASSKPTVRHTGEPVEAANRLRFEVSGFSRCPDYVDINEQIIYPLFERYPELYSILNYSFLTLSVPNDRYITGVLAMHGQTEAYGDLALVCFADTLADRIYFDRFTKCLYRDSGSVPFNVDSCIDEVAPGYSGRIRQCISSDHGARLVAEGRERSIQLSGSWSPTVYIDGKVSCVWGASCNFEDHEGLRVEICNTYAKKFGRTPDVCQ